MFSMDCFQIQTKAIMAGVLGEPKTLDTGCLPKKNDVFNFYKKVRSDGILQGKWKEGAVTIGEVARKVLVEICALWCKTPIPSLCDRDPAAAAKEVSKVVKQGRDLLRIPIPRRKSDFGAKFNCLFDLAICKHQSQEDCDSPAADMVPDQWHDYLADQRGPRKQLALLNRLHLRAAASSLPTTSADHDESSKHLQQIIDSSTARKAAAAKAKERAEGEKEMLKRKVSFESSFEEENEIQHWTRVNAMNLSKYCQKIIL